MNKLWLYILLFIALAFACRKNSLSPNSTCGYVPAYVDTVINLDDIALFGLKSNGFAYIRGGYRGVFIYKLSDHYVAFERASSYNMATVGCQVKMDKSLFYLNDTCSGSRFDPSDGAVLKGPAVCPLLEYDVTPYSSNQIRIHYSP